MPDATLLVVIGLVLLALAFDFTNGFHDAANSIATVVSTRVLTPRVAVIWAAIFNFVAFLVFHTKVADTVGKIVDPGVVSVAVIFAGLVGAIGWNLVTWWLGLPTSSSHALIGGFVGAGVAKAGWGVVNSKGLNKTLLFIPLSPLLGLAMAFVLMLAITWLLRRRSPWKVDRLFRRLQLLSAAAFSLGHGGNDAQKTMGIIAALLVGTGHLKLGPGGELPVPLWIVLSAHAAIALGTLSGGWRIVKTLGHRITALKPPQGFAAETSGAASLYLATYLGVPVSTTHTITGAVVGAGSTRRLSAVRWGVARGVVFAWLVTIPAAGAIAALAYELTTREHPAVAVLTVAVLTGAGAAAAAARSRRRGRRPDPDAAAAEAGTSVSGPSPRA
jgi:PiT family inorganic phosphate transporter